MSSRVYVRELAEKNGIEPVGPIVEDPDTKNGFLIFVKVSQDKNGESKPSSLQISRTLKAAKKNGSQIKLAFLNERETLLNTTVNLMLSQKFSEQFENAVVSVTDSISSVFVETKDDTTDDDQEAMQSSISELLGYMGVDNSQVVFSRSLRLPTATTILAAVRRYSPIGRDTLVELLQKRGFDRPADSWTDNTLDSLRKKRFVFRRSDKKFIMTFQGLSATGTLRNRYSPDVSRALALSRVRQ